jgi:GntR family transcriptional regulator
MSVSRARPEPLYHQVVDEIRRRIESGQWVAGDRVPSERQLAEILDVSRITVRHAVRLAVSEGLLQQRRGVGTFVGEPDRLSQDLSEVRSFERTLAQEGHVASTEILRSEIVVSDLAVSGTLQVDPAAPVYNLRLLGCRDSSPVVFYDSYFGQGHGREMARAAATLRDADKPFSTLDLYRQDSVSRVLTQLSQTIEAVAASPEIAAHLRVDVGSPVLAVESVMADDSGPLEFRRAYYRADRYKFGLKRRLGNLTA